MFPRIDKGPIEYRLNICPALNKRDKSPVMRFHFETAEEFHYFQYQLSIETREKRGTMEFRIKGLRPQIVTIPQDGNAIADVDVPYREGRFQVSVTKPGNITNTFTIAVEADRITLDTMGEAHLTFLHVNVQEDQA